MKLSAFLPAAFLALVVATPLAVQPASAAPVTMGADAMVNEGQRAGDIEQAQYYYRRPYYRRPVVVCRTRYTYYGPRRVCARRY